LGEERFFQSLAEGAGVWRLLLVVIAVALLIFVALRMATSAVADRRTRKILLDAMADEEDESPGRSEQRPGTVKKKP
jgi:Sec-independent protein translocase protein TatA